MLDTLRFWLDRGVDGFRMDVVHLIAKEIDRDDPPAAVAAGRDHVTYNDVPAVQLRHDDELHLSFNFRFLWAPFDAGQLRSRITTTLATLAARGAWPTWVLSNHDAPRHRQRYGGDERVARMAAVVLLTLPGTPFLYQGEELGLLDAVVPPTGGRPRWPRRAAGADPVDRSDRPRMGRHTVAAPATAGVRGRRRPPPVT